MLSTTTRPDLHKQGSFHIKQDDKFFSKLLSKEASTANPSFRVYYGDVSGAIPFTWETQPGTPKHALSDASSLPPLTPPPAYNSRVSKGNSMNKHSNRSSNLLNMRTLVMRIITTMRKKKKKSHHHVPLSPSYCSSSLSSLSWSSSSQSSTSFSAGAVMMSSATTNNSDFHRSRGSYFAEHQDNNPHGSWTFCFGLGKANGSVELQVDNSAGIGEKHPSLRFSSIYHLLRLEGVEL